MTPLPGARAAARCARRRPVDAGARRHAGGIRAGAEEIVGEHAAEVRDVLLAQGVERGARQSGDEAEIGAQGGLRFGAARISGEADARREPLATRRAAADARWRRPA